MSIKDKTRNLVPPVIWAFLSRSKRKAQSRILRSKCRPADLVVDDKFSILFKKVARGPRVYFVPKYAEHRPASRAILAGDVYEPATHDLIDRIFQHKSGSMVHAGTFFGDMLPTFAQSCTGIVYAFEPVLENYVLAKLCVNANNLENVYLQNAGLSDCTSVARIDTGNEDQPHRGGASRLSETGQLTGLVTIDSLGLDDVVVIQLDVEGHELSALKGARNTIERNAPIIMIEDNSRVCNAFLEDMGYSHVTNIPGLFIWTRPAERSLVEG